MYDRALCSSILCNSAYRLSKVEKRDKGDCNRIVKVIDYAIYSLCKLLP